MRLNWQTLYLPSFQLKASLNTLMISTSLSIIFIIALTACGGSSEGSSSSTTSDNHINIAPLSINEHYLKISFTPSQALPTSIDLPAITNGLNHFFGRGNVAYLQTETDKTWRNNATFSYVRDAATSSISINTATISVFLSNSNREYKINLDFTDSKSGQYRASFDDTIQLSGRFVLSPISEDKDFNFQGSTQIDKSITSSITGITYPYHVYLPEGYQDSAKSYPIIYATDGQWEYWRFAHAIESSNKDIILVAIEQGANDRRLIDYALEGSESYLQFLENEMLPLIEGKYRVDSNNRTIQGASWGGLLVRHALSRNINQPLFRNFISMDGSYWNEDAQYQQLEDIAFPSGSNLPGNLYLSGATQAGNNTVVKQFYRNIKARDIAELSIYFTAFDVKHEEVARPSIKDALIKLFP
jgi:predicted alpha/beta superfamily hydrolase